MSEGILTWQQTAAPNATASDAVNWAENQPPPTVNNSARNMMAEVAKWRDDLAGVRDADRVLETSGGPNAHVIVTSNLSINPSVLTNGWELTWVAGAGLTNTGPTTFSPDAMDPKPLRCKAGIDMAGGEIIAGQMYTCVYHKTADEWLMKSGGGLQVPSSQIATVAEIRSAVANKIIDTDGFWGVPFPVDLGSFAAGATIPFDFSSGLNFKVAVTGANAKFGNITGGKPGQSGIIEVTAVGGNYDVVKDTKWLGTVAMASTNVQNGTTAHFYYSVIPSSPDKVMITGIINNPS
jgi:hypothetical protein